MRLLPKVVLMETAAQGFSHETAAQGFLNKRADSAKNATLKDGPGALID